MTCKLTAWPWAKQFSESVIHMTEITHIKTKNKWQKWRILGRPSRTCRLLVTICRARPECSLLCVLICGNPTVTSLGYLAVTYEFHTSSGRHTHRLSNMFDVMSFLHGGDFSHRTRQRTVHDTKTRSLVPSAPPCKNRNFTPCNQPSLAGHADNAKTLSLVPSEPSNQHFDNIPLLAGRTAPFSLPNSTHSSNTRSITDDQLRHTLVMTSRQSFELSESKKMWWSRLRPAGKWVVANLSLLSPKEDVQHDFSTLLTRTGFSDASCHFCSNNRTNTRIVKNFTHRISVDVRLLESGIIIATVRTDTIHTRSARSACVQYGNCQHFCTDDWKILIGFAVCFKLGHGCAVGHPNRMVSPQSASSCFEWLRVLALLSCSVVVMWEVRRTVSQLSASSRKNKNVENSADSCTTETWVERTRWRQQWWCFCLESSYCRSIWALCRHCGTRHCGTFSRWCPEQSCSLRDGERVP